MALVVKNLSAADPKSCRFHPQARKIFWRRAWQPTPVFLLGEFHGQRSLAVHGVTELDMTEQLNRHTRMPAVISKAFYFSTTLRTFVSVFCFIFGFQVTCGILVLRPGMELMSPIGCRVLTTGLPRKSLKDRYLKQESSAISQRLYSTFMCVLFAHSCLTLCDPMEFSRQEYWSGLPFPSPEDFSNSGTKPGSPALQADSLPPELPGKTTAPL